MDDSRPQPSKRRVGILSLTLSNAQKTDLKKLEGLPKETLKGSMIPMAVVKWVEALGVEPVPLDIRMPDRIFEVLPRLSGLVLTGGHLKLFEPNTPVGEMLKKADNQQKGDSEKNITQSGDKCDDSTPQPQEDKDDSTPQPIDITNQSTPQPQEDKDGSTVQPQPTAYLKLVFSLLSYAKKECSLNRPFPIFSICLGFESLLIAEANFKDLRVSIADNNHRLCRPLSQPDPFSRMLSPIPEPLKSLFSEPCFQYNHIYGLPIAQVAELTNVKINAALNWDNRLWAAGFEFENYPFFGVQFHPEAFEKPQKSNSNLEDFEKYREVNREIGKCFAGKCQRICEEGSMLDVKCFDRARVFDDIAGHWKLLVLY